MGREDAEPVHPGIRAGEPYYRASWWVLEHSNASEGAGAWRGLSERDTRGGRRESWAPCPEGGVLTGKIGVSLLSSRYQCK